MLQPLIDDEADFVVASRRLGTDTTTDRFRKAGVVFFSSIMNRMTGAKPHRHLERLPSPPRDDARRRRRPAPQEQYQTAELLITCLKRGWRVTERPTVWLPRQAGHHQEGQELALRVPLRQGGLRHLVAGALAAAHSRSEGSAGARGASCEVVGGLDRLSDGLGLAVHRGPGHPSALAARRCGHQLAEDAGGPSAAAGARPPWAWPRSEPPMPTGTTGASARAERKPAPSRMSSTTGPSRRVPSGKSTSTSPAAQHGLGVHERRAIRRLTVDGEGAEGDEQRPRSPSSARGCPWP